MDIANTLAEKAYKKVIIYYFSGTGNSRNVAKWMASVSQQYQVEILDKSYFGSRYALELDFGSPRT
jgi:flavodoxin